LIFQGAFPCCFCLSLGCGTFGFSSSAALGFQSLFGFRLCSPASIIFSLKSRALRLSLRLRFAIGGRLSFSGLALLVLALERD
jgi:hypothetical protein